MKVEAAGTAAAAASALHDELGIDRLSIARFGPGYFEIVAAAGKALFVPGQRLPTTVSTQLAVSAGGHPFATSSFISDLDPPRPVDQLMLTLGFRSGCSVPLGPVDKPVGAVSLSSTVDGLCYDRVLRAVTEVEAPLLHILSGDGDARGAALVCHEDEMIAAGLAWLLLDRFSLTPRLARTIDEAVAIARGEALRLIVCGTRIGEMHADTLVRLLRSAGTAAPVVMVPSADTTAGRRAASRADVSAYIPRQLGTSRIAAAIASVRQGWTTLPDFGDDLGQPLTRREGDILAALDEGLTFRGIGRRYGIAENTAKSYGRNLFRKLGVHSRGEAVAKARQAGILG